MPPPRAGVADEITGGGRHGDVGRRRRDRPRAGAGDDRDGGDDVRRAERHLQQRRHEPPARLHGGRRGELRRDRPRQHLGRDRLHAGGRAADDRAGQGRQDRQHRVDRGPPGLLGLHALLRREVRRRRGHPGDGPRPDPARHHGQRVRARCGRHADVDRPQRGPARDPRPGRRRRSDDRLRSRRHADGPPRRSRRSSRRSWSTSRRPSRTT